MKRRAGFTIIELLMVLGIISVLLTVVVTSVTGSIKRARGQRASALCTLVQQGLTTYYAQQGEWPWGEKASNNADGTYWLTSEEVRKAIYDMVRVTLQDHKPVMDVSGLFVSARDGEPGQRVFGMDFMLAVRPSRKSDKVYRVGQLYFGYPESENGYFRRFVIKYSPATDSVSVRTYTAAEEKAGSVKNEDEKNN